MSSPRQKGLVRNSSPRHTIKHPAGLPAFEMLHLSGKTEGFVITIIETSPTPSQSPSTIHRSQITEIQPPSPRPQPPPLTIPRKAYIAEEQICAKPSSPPLPSPSRNRAPSRTEIPLPSSKMSTPPLARNKSIRSESNETPVMRSMFPRYNPSLPFAHQQYAPKSESITRLANTVAVTRSSSFQRKRDDTDFTHLQLGREQLEATDVKESLFNAIENTQRATTLSSPEELMELWGLANGQAVSEEAADTYTLELSCDDLAIGREVITFSSSTSDPIYTLEAAVSNITISRIHPLNRNPTIQITSSILSKPSVADPLVASVFPKLAGLMAVDQSSNVAVAHRLDRKASADLQVEAVSRAQEKESSMLLWDSDSDKYCLLHPTLLDSTATTLPIEILPNPSSPQRITIFAPETNTPLLTLSLQSLALTLHIRAMNALPSLYILDTLLSTLLTLLLHLHRSCAPSSSSQTNSVSPATPVFPPPPILAYGSPRSSLRKKRSTPRFSTSRSTKSMKSNRSLRSASVCQQDIEMQSLSAVPASSKLGWRHQPPKQTFSINDESLSKTTRAVLKLLYWIFDAIFWVMGLLVQLLAAGVVGAGKLIKKF